MSPRHVFIALTFALCLNHAHGQTINLMDTLGVAFQQQPKLQIRWDSRNSFITGNGASIFGIKVGAEFGNNIAVGVGYNWLYNRAQTDLFLNEEEGTVPSKTVFRYFAPYFVYSFYHKDKWLVSIPVQVGVGMSRQQYEDERGATVKLNQDWVALYEPAMILEYQVLPFIGIGGGVGYRLMLKNNRKLGGGFTAPTYKLNFNVKFGVLYDLIQSGGSLR